MLPQVVAGVSLGSQQIFSDESHWERLCWPGLTHSKQQSGDWLGTGGLLRALALEVSALSSRCPEGNLRLPRDPGPVIPVTGSALLALIVQQLQGGRHDFHMCTAHHSL